MSSRQQTVFNCLKSFNYLFSTVMLLLIFCFTGTKTAAQDKIPFGSNDTLEEIQAKIQHNGYSFEVGHNWVFDLTPEEKARMFPARRAPAPEKRIIAPHSDIILKATGLTTAAKFDWRDYNGHSYIGPIRNQGKNGTCYSFGACAAAESTYNFANGLYDGNCVDFAEMYIIWTLSSELPYNGQFNNDRQGSGAGNDFYELYALTKSGSPRGSVGYEGLCFEAAFPYSDSKTSPSAEVIANSKTFPRVTFKQFNRVYPANYADTTEQIKTAISTYGCVDVEVSCDPAFLAYKSGVYENTNTQPDASPYYYSQQGHCVSLVGWDDNPPEGGGGCWILRNEWGPNWGENGYMRIRYFSAMVNTAAAYLEFASPGGQYSIRGKIAGALASGITISSTGTASSITITDHSGDYILAGLDNGTYTVTPTEHGYSFDPPSRTITVSGGNVTDCNFTSKESGIILKLATLPANAGNTYPSETTPSYVHKNEWVYISAVPTICHAFTKWTLPADAELKYPASSAVNEVRLAGNATVTAEFKEVPPPETVTLNMGTWNEHGTVVPAKGPSIVPYNSPISIDAIPAAGYSFSGWGFVSPPPNPGKIEDPHMHATKVTLLNNATVYATFIKTNVDLTMGVTPSGSGSTTPIGVHTVASNVSIEIEATPADGYFFTKWINSNCARITGGSPHIAKNMVRLVGDATVTANFAPIDKTAKLTMAVTPGNSGTTTPVVGEQVIPVGAYIQIEAIPAPGYFFNGWTSVGSTKITNPFLEKNELVLSGDATVTANFMPIVNTATLNIATEPYYTNSTTNPGVGQYIVPVGAWTEIEAFPGDGFFFLNWDLVGNAEIKDLLSEKASVSLIGNATLTANFAAIVNTAKLTLAVSPDASGSTNPSTGEQTVAIGDHIEIEAIPENGYFFTNWTCTANADITDPFNEKTLVVLSGDAAVTANFAKMTSQWVWEAKALTDSLKASHKKVAISSDGKTLFVGGWHANLLMSKDAGASWLNIYPPGGDWTSVSC